MRTTAPLLALLCIGVVTGMMTMSGFAGAWSAPQPQTTGVQDELDQGASDVNPAGDQGSASGPVSSGESSIVGLVVDGSKRIVQLAAAVALFPATLMNLGAPAWFALPVGSFVYLMTGIGVIEFATNREWT